MKLDSISTIVEIAPYYGVLDDVYRLMRRGNRKMNQMWDSISVKLSERTWRKLIDTNLKNEGEILDVLLKYPLTLTLFTSDSIDILNKDQHGWIIELFEKFKSPEMIDISFGFARNKYIDTWITLSDYRESMKHPEFTYIDLYNKIVDIAIERKIKLEWIVAFALVHEILELKDVKYIKSILFPWNNENEADEMIKIWREFTESKKFEYSNVTLIWDGMDVKSFIKIYNILTSQNVNIRIISRKSIANLVKFMSEIVCNQKRESYI